MENDSIRYGDVVECAMCDECAYRSGEVLEVSLDGNYQTVARVAWIHGETNRWPIQQLKKLGGIVAETKGCRHVYKLYRGFNEIYEYCAKCDEKKTPQ